jgi:glycerophosphoryl diester phosphodiesterase
LPEIIAHRGASRERLENTLPAFQRALDLGADAVELDVHCTADGAVVVHHDPSLGGISTDPALTGTPIARLTTAQLATFRLANGDAVPTLAEVATSLGSKARLYCELKGEGTAGPACAVLGAHPVSSAFHSFDHRRVATAATVAPHLPRGILEVSRHVDPTASMQSVGARDLWQLVEYIDEALVQQVHAAGGRVIAWTVNDPTVAGQLAAWGVDGLCGDDVTMLRRVLGR